MKEEMNQNDYEIVAVSNRKLCTGDFFDCVGSAINDGAKYLILREKDLAYGEYTDLAVKTAAFIDSLVNKNERKDSTEKRNKIVNLILNVGSFTDRNTIRNLIKETGCKNIHLPFDNIKYNTKLREVHRLTDGLVGMSIHDRAEAVMAEQYGADYIVAGHIFQTSCKPGLKPRGLDFLAGVCRSVRIPVYAVGGMTKENAPLAARAGAKGICIMSGYFN